jgi:hypothetical protein
VFSTLTFGQKEVAIEVTKEETKMVAFLGVETSRISQPLRNHIDLPEGIGLTISHIAEDSGAAKAAIQQYDILHKVDDQIIVNQEQLKTYIRSKYGGDKVSLAILRKGKKLKISVTLGEKEEATHTQFMRDWTFPSPPPIPSSPNGNWNFNFNSEEFQERMKRFSEHAAEMGNRAMQFIPQIIVEREEVDGSKRITSVGGGPNKVTIMKDELMAKAEMIDGKREYQVLDSNKNKILYEGGEPSEDELKKLPKDVQAIIKQLNDTQSFNWDSFEDLKKDKIRVIIPSGEEEANLASEGTGEEA